MKAIAYNIKPHEKECLVLANYKKHDITIIANSLSLETLSFALGKEVLIVFNEDVLDRNLVLGLKELGVKYIATSSQAVNHIDLSAAKEAPVILQFLTGKMINLLPNNGRSVLCRPMLCTELKG